MRPIKRRGSLAAALALAGGLVLAAGTAQAQPNTYADVPFNQGSLFYRPRGARPPRTRSTPRRTQATRSYAPTHQVVPQQPANAPQVRYYYVQPQYSYPYQYQYPHYNYRPGRFGGFR